MEEKYVWVFLDEYWPEVFEEQESALKQFNNVCWGYEAHTSPTSKDNRTYRLLCRYDDLHTHTAVFERTYPNGEKTTFMLSLGKFNVKK